MSNYYPLTMNRWKIHKRSVEMSQLLQKTSTPRHRSHVIHSLGVSTNSQPRKLRENSLAGCHRSLPHSKFEMRSSGGFKSFSKEGKASDKDIARTHKRVVEQRYRSEFALGKERYGKLRSSALQNNTKQHHIKKEQTLKEMKNTGMEKMLIIRSPKVAIAPSQTSLIEASPRYFLKQSESANFSPYRERRTASAKQRSDRCLVNPLEDEVKMESVQQNEGEPNKNSIFLQIKDCYLHDRSPKTNTVKINSWEKLCRQYETFQRQRNKCLKKAKKMKLQHLPITPWEIQEQQT